ncbi:MAG: hypothetical protein CME61_05965 [Halobacteriovoraceae bacterium]|nr:hypothetical protein [Halobacteriovoraceae bacterium]
MEKEKAELILVRKLSEEAIGEPSLEVNELTGDASSRRYYRVRTNKKTYVGCLGDRFLENNKSDFLNVQKMLKSNMIKVPEIYSTASNEGFYLEEDLGDLTLVNVLGRESEEDKILSYYEEIILILNKLQKIPTKGTIVGDRSFDLKKLSQESDLAVENFLEKYLGAPLKKEEKRLLETELFGMNKILGDGSYKVFCHRDLHSRNIMEKDNSLYLIDFQDARMGLPFYDLVSLLEDCYYPLKKDQREKLISFFIKTNEHHDFYKDQFKYWYNLSAIQRVFKALGSFTYINYLRNDDRYLKYVGVGVGRLLELLEEVEGFENFKKVLKRSYHEN